MKQKLKLSLFLLFMLFGIMTVSAYAEDYTITVNTLPSNSNFHFPETKSYPAGSDVALNWYTSINGSYIESVSIDGNNFGSIQGFVFNDLQSDHTINLTWYFNRYNTYNFNIFQVFKSVGGSISPSGLSFLGYNLISSNSIFHITPDEGYQIKDVLVDGESQGAISIYNTGNWSLLHRIEAVFESKPITHKITSRVIGRGTISPGGDTEVVQGRNQTYSITPNSGYSIKDVKVDGISQGSVSTYTFTSVQSAHTIEAEFELIKYPITATSGNGGIVSPNGVCNLDYGVNQTYTITPNTGYYIKNVKVDGLSQGAISTYTFTNVQAAHTIEAEFGIYVYTITSNCTLNGTITPLGSNYVNHGEDKSYQISANTGYIVKDVKVDGISVGAVNIYDFTNVTGNHTIYAEFEPKKIVIQSSSNGNGSITPDGNTTILYGNDQTFSIVANTGSIIKDVLVDGVSVGAVRSYAFSQVTTDHTITAEFESIKLTLTFSSSTGGTISPSGSVQVDYGSSYSFSTISDEGYSVQYVLANNSKLQGTSLDNITEDITVYAFFGVYLVPALPGIDLTLGFEMSDFYPIIWAWFNNLAQYIPFLILFIALIFGFWVGVVTLLKYLNILG